MRTIILALLAGVTVFGATGSVSAQRYASPMPIITLCPPGHLLQGGVCVERPHAGPGRNAGIGDGSGDDMGCQWGAAPIFSGLLCPSGGARQPRAR